MQSRRLPAALMALINITLLAQSAAAVAVNVMDARSLLPRADTCSAGKDLKACGQGMPTDFCCGNGATCLVLNNTGLAAAALCCPAGQTCDSINVITCEISFQDPRKFPESPVHISDLTKKLDTCGKGCCPHGYECIDGNQCQIKDSAKQAPKPTSTPTSAASTFVPSSTSTTKPAAPSTPAAATSSPLNVQPKETDHANVAGLVFAGLIPGLVVGAFIVMGILYYKRKQREKNGYTTDKSSSFFGPPTPHGLAGRISGSRKISSPIYQPGMSDRTVFGHKRTPSGNIIPEEDEQYNGYYAQANQTPGSTADSATLVSKPSTRKAPRVLDPPFESPRRPGKAAQATGQIRGLFNRPTDRFSMKRKSTKSRGSMETISMQLGPPEGTPRGAATPYKTPDMRQTTYSDVYRAAGISPSKVGNVRPSEDTLR